MTLSEANFVEWMEGQFSPEDRIERILCGMSNTIFRRPRNALQAIYDGERLREAATAVFWYSYEFGGVCRDIGLDSYREGLLNTISKEASSWTEKEREVSQWLITVLSDLIDFRESFSWKPIGINGLEPSNLYLQVMTGAARTLLMLCRFINQNSEIEYERKLTELIGSTYHVVSQGIQETVEFDVDSPAMQSRTFGEGVFGFSACVASGIACAAYARMKAICQEDYEVAFLAYVESFKYFHKANKRWDSFTRLNESGILGLTESLFIYDKLVTRETEIEDWNRLFLAFSEWEDILFDFGIEEEILQGSGINEAAPADWYFPSQMSFLSKRAQEDAKQPNALAFRYISRIEKSLHKCVRHTLEESLGEMNWWEKGIPEKIRNDCTDRCNKAGLKEDPWHYTYFIDLQKIIKENRGFFEIRFQTIRQRSTDKEFLESIAGCNRIRNRVDHPTREPISNKDLSFLARFNDIVKVFCR